MPTVQPITTLNIDGNTLNGTDLSAKVQGLVTVYNGWNQKLADAQDTFALTQAALNDLSRQIILAVKEDADAAANAANDSTVSDSTPAVTTDASPAPTAKE